MIIEQQNSTAIITQDKTSLSEFTKKFSVLHERFKENNVILQLKDSAMSSIDALVSISKIHRQLNQSFAVVSPQLNQDDFEDDFIVVPTLQEAHDYIEMELIAPTYTPNGSHVVELVRRRAVRQCLNLQEPKGPTSCEHLGV